MTDPETVTLGSSTKMKPDGVLVRVPAEYEYCNPVADGSWLTVKPTYLNVDGSVLQSSS
jgi:hypothetical protein